MSEVERRRERGVEGEVESERWTEREDGERAIPVSELDRELL